MDTDESLIWLQAGCELTPEQASVLQQHLAAGPNDFEARAKLLGYAQRCSHWEVRESDLLREQLLWCIANQPSALLHTSGSLHPQSSPSFRVEICALWRAAIAQDPDNLAVLRNAGLGFFSARELESARATFEELERREPQNAHWPAWTARCLSWRPKNAENSALALAAYERALAVEQPREAYTLWQAAESALRCARYDRARELALELLEAARARELGWMRGNANYHGHRILGLVALSEDDPAQAERELVESARTCGSPQLNSFGPELDLANALLQRGRTDSVVEFLELCTRFWKRAPLDSRIAAIRSGARSELDTFFGLRIDHEARRDDANT